MYLNGELIRCDSFEDYVSMYCVNEGSIEPDVENEKENELPSLKKSPNGVCFETIKTQSCTFQVAFIAKFIQDRHFEQVSFVNGVYTMKGGTHINYIMEKISKYLLPLIEKRDAKVG